MSGPFETEREAHSASLWAKQAPGRPAHADTDMTAVNAADLLGVLAGVELGAYDRRIVGWLAGWEPSTVAVICGLIRRFTFAGAAMIRFDLLAAAGCLPGDWPNRSAAVPASHQVGDCAERGTRRTGPDSPNGRIRGSCEAIR